MSLDAKFPNIRLGLCCINMHLRYEKEIYSSRKMPMKSIEKKGIEALKNSAIDNVIDTTRLLLWNKNHGIEVTRISSELAPHATNPLLIEKFGKAGEEYASLEFLRPYLKKVGHVAKLEKMRVSFHPGQFCQVASPTQAVFDATVKELAMHTKYLEMMKANSDAVIVLHIGGVYCDKPTTIARFKERFRTLPKNVRDRLVLENDEKCYDAEEVLEICEELNVPMVFDIFHYYCYGKIHPEIKQKPIDELMPRILETFKKRGIRVKFHLSEQDPAKRTGAHAAFVKEIPKVFLEIPKSYGVQIDIMLESKAKEVSIGRLYKKYPKLKPIFAKPIPLDIPKGALKDLTEDDNEGGCNKCKN